MAFTSLEGTGAVQKAKVHHLPSTFLYKFFLNAQDTHHIYNLTIPTSHPNHAVMQVPLPMRLTPTTNQKLSDQAAPRNTMATCKLPAFIVTTHAVEIPAPAVTKQSVTATATEAEATPQPCQTPSPQTRAGEYWCEMCKIVRADEKYAKCATCYSFPAT
jgi:hypothetical protein